MMLLYTFNASEAVFFLYKRIHDYHINKASNVDGVDYHTHSCRSTIRGFVRGNSLSDIPTLYYLCILLLQSHYFTVHAKLPA